ncbi:hypothetical protein NDU88_011034 [Pleurodeles waltl]|uniref:Uncharacterized protein n=1 Tax=Pleurodeles waltl TaxID=8319 RepID=A0AAV7PZM2_PLEWA|nr:hypothetical protein NDU88_011034 [Pleurodeles waltl]
MRHGRAAGAGLWRAPPQPSETKPQGKRCECGGSGTCVGPGTAQQEWCKAIQSAAAISASSAASESETENSQPPSDRQTTPD